MGCVERAAGVMWKQDVATNPYGLTAILCVYGGILGALQGSCIPLLPGRKPVHVADAPVLPAWLSPLSLQPLLGQHAAQPRP